MKSTDDKAAARGGKRSPRRTPAAPKDALAPRCVEGLTAAQVAYLIAQEAGSARNLVVVADDDQAATLAQDLRALGCADAAALVGDDHTPFSEIASSTRGAMSRFALRERLLGAQPPSLCVASATSIAGTWMPEADFRSAQIHLSVGMDVDREALAQNLVRCGYSRVNTVEDEGTFALRGGVVDIYKPESPWALRLDLFGDELATIKTFAPGSHGAQGTLDSVTVSPIREVLFDDAHVQRATTWLRGVAEATQMPTRGLHALGDQIESRNYFFGIEALWPAFYSHSEAIMAAVVDETTRVTLIDPEAVSAVWQARATRAVTERERATEAHRPQVQVDDHLTPVDVLRERLWRRADLLSVPLRLDPKQVISPTGLGNFDTLATELATRRQDPSRGEILAPLTAWLRERFLGEGTVVLACSNRGHAMRLRELLMARRMNLPVLEALPPVRELAQSRRPVRAIAIAPLSQGIDDRDRGIALLTDHELFGAPAKVPRRRRAPKPTGAGLDTLNSLRPGDLIIHQDHGVGRYDGLVRLVLGGVDGDFARLVYADDDKLYLPVYRLGMLKRYHGSSQNARLDKLGGARWERAKARVRDAVLTMAHTLLALQARRQAHKGFALPAPDAAYAAFAASFPFEETPDQKRAIEAVLADLGRDVPMDRLVCGDVGYGKTEVALRGAFVAAQAGRQVAVLVPTTVLAEQHRHTFHQRLSGHGVVVEVISRFRSAKETADVLARLKSGAVDVLIGTHRLLSLDVEFKNLGLMIVDEEQRFGVKHKERLKQMRAHVHVLTLSATPIPRTLYMATSGLRDLSLIQTPPAQRSAIRTEVMRFDEEVIREAIARELHRGGQVFVVHNRVQTIETMAERIRRLSPNTEVVVAHGQMSADVLEAIMVRFVRREAQVLVCTAIIESGIDIPSANTMIVDRADTFGLSQLYQLRGRIGRGNERAFAYLMLPAEEVLSKDATDRLALLKRFSDLGAGFMVASHDLEMRGAGDLLGADQSGQIAAVGYELYTQLLHEAVQQAQGQGPRTDIEPEIKLSVAAVFPETYMPEPLDRLAYYQRMAQSTDDAGIYNTFSEIRELFGPPPREALGLVALMVLRRRLRALGAHTLTAMWAPEALKVGLAFAPDAAVDRAHLVDLCQQQPGVYRLLPSGKLALTLPAPPPAPQIGKEAPQPLPEDLITAVRQGVETLQTLKI